MKKFPISIFIALALAISVMGQAAHNKPEVTAVIDSCKLNFPNIKDDLIKDIITPGFKTDDHNVKCFGKCVGEVLGYIDQDGKLKADKLKSGTVTGLDVNQIDSIMQECGSKIGTEACDTAYHQWTCLMNKKKI